MATSRSYVREATMNQKTFRIFGRLIDHATRRGIPGLRIEAWDKDLIYDDLVASAITGAQGTFEMIFDCAPFQQLLPERSPDLYFKIFYRDRLLHSTEDSVLWNARMGDHEVEIEIDDSTGEGPPMPENFVVRGRIVGHELRGLPGRHVVAVDKNVGGDVPLGEGTTGERGAYEIGYSGARLRKEKPDVQVQVTIENGEVLAA